MPFTRFDDRQRGKVDARLAGRTWSRQIAWLATCIAAAVLLAGAGPPQKATQTSPPSSDATQPLVPDAKNVPSVHLKSGAPGPKSIQTSTAGLSANPNGQVAKEAAELLRLAMDLKAEVDKTNSATLSVRVVRKAEEIRQLAHSVREKVNQNAQVP